MKKPNIKKLQYPLWFNITFYILTILLPIVLVMVQGYKSPNGAFRWTFGIITGLILVWSFLKKFLLKGKIKLLRDKKATLEHEYEIELGNTDKVKYLWFVNEELLTALNAIEVAIFGGLIALLAYGAASGLFAIKASTCMISICYIVAYTIKFIVITTLKGNEYKEEEVDGQETERERTEENI